MSVDRSQSIPAVVTAAAGCSDAIEATSPSAAYFHTSNAATIAKPRSSDPTLNVDIAYLLWGADGKKGLLQVRMMTFAFVFSAFQQTNYEL